MVVFVSLRYKDLSSILGTAELHESCMTISFFPYRSLWAQSLSGVLGEGTLLSITKVVSRGHTCRDCRNSLS